MVTSVSGVFFNELAKFVKAVFDAELKFDFPVEKRIPLSKNTFLLNSIVIGIS